MATEEGLRQGEAGAPHPRWGYIRGQDDQSPDQRSTESYQLWSHTAAAERVPVGSKTPSPQPRPRQWGGGGHVGSACSTKVHGSHVAPSFVLGSE